MVCALLRKNEPLCTYCVLGAARCSGCNKRVCYDNVHTRTHGRVLWRYGNNLSAASVTSLTLCYARLCCAIRKKPWRNPEVGDVDRSCICRSGSLVLKQPLTQMTAFFTPPSQKGLARAWVCRSRPRESSRLLRLVFEASSRERDANCRLAFLLRFASASRATFLEPCQRHLG